MQIPSKERLKRVERNKSVLAEVEEAITSEAVKLPQIEIKKRRGRPRKNQNVAEEVQEIQNITIEEFIPSLVRISYLKKKYTVICYIFDLKFNE